MNERIRECWVKAAREDAGETWDSQEQFIERFAELIVRDCASICESMQLIGPYKDIQDATLKDAAIQIKNHFGIEE
jgi:hypothetical protein